MILLLIISYTILGFVIAEMRPEVLSGRKTYGHSMEYHYEFNPSKSPKPIVQVKYDKIDSPSDIEKLFSSPPFMKNSNDVRFAPRKYFPDRNQYPFMPIGRDEMIRDGDDQQNHWREGWNRRPQQFARIPYKDNMSEHLAAYMRRESERLISSQIPEFSQIFSNQHNHNAYNLPF